MDAGPKVTPKAVKAKPRGRTHAPTFCGSGLALCGSRCPSSGVALQATSPGIDCKRCQSRIRKAEVALALELAEEELAEELAPTPDPPAPLGAQMELW